MEPQYISGAEFFNFGKCGEPFNIKERRLIFIRFPTEPIIYRVEQISGGA
jgi:hypothetical protein